MARDNPSISPTYTHYAVPVSNSTIIAQLTDEIKHSLRAFHNHSKTCRPCRNPVQAYQQSLDLCRTGRELSIAITKLLYKKAEHVPHGSFTVEYKQGWTAVDGLIRIICHYNQGEFTNEVVDLKRISTPADNAVAARPRSQVDRDMAVAIPRGSMYEEDLRRRQRARSPSRSSAAAYYGNPRVSYLDTPSARTQAEVSPASSSRSVHFDSHIHVREFHT